MVTGRGRASASLYFVTVASGRSTRVSFHGRKRTPGSSRSLGELGADGGGLLGRETGVLAAGGRSCPRFLVRGVMEVDVQRQRKTARMGSGEDGRSPDEYSESKGQDSRFLPNSKS